MSELAERTSSASLVRFAWLSIAAAVVTISMKAGAYLLTGSVGLLSDALESVVNLVAAIVALIALSVAAREPDEERAYGYQKAEYFSSGTEGGLILLAAVGIIVAAVDRLLHPAPLEAVGWGLGVSALASVVNLGVALRLRVAPRDGKRVVRLLDPCAGTGAAVAQLGRALGAETFGIELSAERAAEAREVIDHLLATSAFWSPVQLALNLLVWSGSSLRSLPRRLLKRCYSERQRMAAPLKPPMATADPGQMV